MKIELRQWMTGHALAPVACALALGVTGCGAASSEDARDTAQSVTAAQDGGTGELLAGPWTFARSDISPSTSYAISDNSIHLSFGGYYTWNGTWASGFSGYTFAQPVAIEAGATYQLTLTVSNLNTPIPVYLRASLSGAGPVQSQMIYGSGTIQLTFTVATDPGSAPVVELTAHPPLGNVGPIQGTGIVFQSYDVAGSLVRVE